MSPDVDARWATEGLDEDARSLLAELARNMPRPFHELGVAASRTLAMFDSVPVGPSLALVRDHRVGVDGGSITVREYRPDVESVRPAVMYLHGGGWSIGSLDNVDAVCRVLADRAQCCVFSVDYRQAPEFRFPVPLDDCTNALEWLVDHADDLRVDPGRVALAGDSAGGNLAAALAIRSRDERGPALAATVLVYPAVTTYSRAESMRVHADAPVLTATDVKWFWNLYLGNATNRSNPLAAPMQAKSLRGLPPTMVLTADQDPLRDDAEALAHRLAVDGVRVRTERYRGVYHGFFGLVGLLDSADQAVSDASDFLLEAFTSACITTSEEPS